MTIRARPSASDSSSWGAQSTASSADARGRFPGAFAGSLLLHAGIAGLVVLAAWRLHEEVTKPEPEFVWVQPDTMEPGGGSRIRESASVADVGAAAAAAAAAAAHAGPDFVADMRRRQRVEERRAEQEIARMREQRRQEERRKAAEEAAEASERDAVRRDAVAATEPASLAARRAATSYSEFLQNNAPRAGSSRPATRADEPGPRVRVGEAGRGREGSGVEARPGAGSTAVVESSAMARYFGDLVLRLRAAHEKPVGLSELLSAEVEFVLAADGTISGLRIVRPSGNADFDRSAREAFARVRMSARPDGKTDTQRLTFRMAEA